MNDKKLFHIAGLFIIISFLFSCKYEKEGQDAEMTFEEKFESQRDSIMNMLISSHGKRIRFLPQDTFLELPANMNIRLWRNSFLDKDSNIYKGIVDLKVAFITNSSDLLVEQFLTFPHYRFKELKGILKIEVKDEHGNLLNFNPNYSTSIWFDPKLNLLSGIGWDKDSMSDSYYKPIELTEVFRQPLEDHNSEDSIGPPYLIDLSLISDTTMRDLNKGEKVRHKGAMMTKKEVIGYELTIKEGTGFFYISRQDRQENLKEANLVVQLETDVKDFQAKVLLYSYNEGLTYFLQGKQISDYQYKIIPPDGHYSLQLPLNKKFTALAYFIKDDKIYFGKTPNIQLSPNSLINLSMKETSLEDFVKLIKDM